MKILPSPKKPAVQLASVSVDMCVLLWRWLVCWSSGRRTRRGLMKTSSRWGRYKEPVMSVLTRCSLSIHGQPTNAIPNRSFLLASRQLWTCFFCHALCLYQGTEHKYWNTCPSKEARIFKYQISTDIPYWNYAYKIKLNSDEKIVHIIHTFKY